MNQQFHDISPNVRTAAILLALNVSKSVSLAIYPTGDPALRQTSLLRDSITVSDVESEGKGDTVAPTSDFDIQLFIKANNKTPQQDN